MSKILILLIVLTTLINLSECKVDRCRQPKLEGNNCGGTRWWYVAKEKACKPFQYKGCGGNQNNFDSFASCQKACKGH
uniref:BPTI/Kunitz inhibitor domain-containing protein n=1 Tax=Meloidogyne incognita TaxID=6306 RepID=A0A914MDQ6_MELIC